LRTKNVLSWVVSLILLAAGVALIASFFLASNMGSTATNTSNPGRFNVPELDATREGAAAEGPEDKTLRLTIPEMDRIKNDTVPNAEGDNERALGSHAAIHLRGTGFPGRRRPTSTSPATASATRTPTAWLSGTSTSSRMATSST
jgi:sortase A